MAADGGRAGAAFLSRINVSDPPLRRVAPVLEPPSGPPLSRRVVLVIIDGLGAARALDLPVLNRLRGRGVSAVASSELPTLSRPNFAAILTGATPADSGVRSNDYAWALPIDSVFARVRAAGGEAAFATDTSPSVGQMFADDLADASQAPWAGGLDRAGALAVARRYPLVVLLPGSVDRAGHAAGANSAAYREAARAVDDQIGRILAELDLERDTIVVTADHGHRPAGGHGGAEPEVMAVPLVLAGAGVERGARVLGARLIDVAPTIAALLGVAAPGHASGRALVEALHIPAARAEAIAASDARRVAALAAALRDAPPASRAADERGRWAAGCAVPLLALLAWLSGARFDRAAALLAVSGYPLALVLLIAVSGGELSLSSVANLSEVQSTLLVSASIAAGAHAAGTTVVLRGKSDLGRLGGAVGIGAASLALSTAICLVTDLALGPPWAELPPSLVLFLLPAAELARATCGAAVAIGCVLEAFALAARAGLPGGTTAPSSPGDAGRGQPGGRMAAAMAFDPVERP